MKVRSQSWLGLLGCVVFASPVLAETPAWCKALGEARVSVDQNFADIATETAPHNALQAIVGGLCVPPRPLPDETVQLLETARASWSKRLDMNDDDWAAATAYAQLRYNERAGGGVRGSEGLEKRAWSSLEPVDQYVMVFSDAGRSGDLALDHNYFVDALGPKLTEAGRLAYITGCIGSSRNGPVQWAMCQGDLDVFDAAKLSKELREDKAASGEDKVRIKIALDVLRPSLVTHAARVKKLLASDPAYVTLFELAATARKTWAELATAQAPLLALTSAMDDARATNSRKAFAGCVETTRAAWKSAASSVPARKFTGMHDALSKGTSFIDLAMGPLMGEPRVYLASVALATCSSAQEGGKEDVLARVLEGAMERWPGFRGPRNTAATLMRGAGLTLDDRDAQLEYPEVRRSFGGGGGGTRAGGGGGVVAKVTKAGTIATVEFKKQLVKQVQCAQSKTTNRITQITASGALIYESFCTRTETVTVNTASGLQKVNAVYLEGLSPGAYASIIEDVVIAVWKAPDAATPAFIFGAPLK